MDIRVRIGKRIKELRLELSLTQEALADKVDLDKTYINEVENGKRNVSVINLEKIILGLDISIKSFYNTEDFK
jgi:transcriptional regulator with XRE-family HTH domain